MAEGVTIESDGNHGIRYRDPSTDPIQYADVGEHIYTVPQGIQTIGFTILGAGGGGAGANATQVAWFHAKGAGSGAEAIGFLPVQGGDNIVVILGDRGNRGYGHQAGTNGGTSYLKKNGTIVATIYGGQGSYASHTGGAGGTYSFGSGVYGTSQSSNGNNGGSKPSNFRGGHGASSPLGTGGTGHRNRAHAGDASGYGAGGAGAGTDNGSSYYGGYGTPAWGKIYPFIQANHSTTLSWS